MPDHARARPRSSRPPHARRLAARLLGTLLATALLAACGSSASPPGDPDGTPPGGSPAAPFTGATSVSCTNTGGAAALYWDFMNGIIRADYPETVRFLPYAPGVPFIHPQQPLYSFMYPPTWEAVTLTDPSLQLTGANVVRSDGRAVWRRLNLTLSGAFTATDVLAIEINQMLDILGVAGPVEPACALTSADDTRAARLLTAGDFTANVTVQVFPSSFLGGAMTTVFVQLAVAPTVQYADTVVGVFFPLSGQMNLGGGSSDPECSDGADNDGDGRTDYPNDEGCSSEFDDTEAG